MGIGMILVLSISAIGFTFFEESFSNFMNSTPLDDELEKNSRMLSEINSQSATYQENNEQEKLDNHKITMQEKLQKIANYPVGKNNIKVVLEHYNFPFEDASNVKPFSDGKSFPICDIPSKIPIHLQNIQNTEMFQIFNEKYAPFTIELIIVDERKHDSDIHYAFLAKSEDENFTALTFFDVDSCTDKISDDYRYFISCRDKNQDYNFGLNNRDEVISNLNSDEFCVIPPDK
jgi:hypothetical protein